MGRSILVVLKVSLWSLLLNRNKQILIPPVVITSLSILGKKYKPAGVQLNIQSLNLDYNKNNVVFEFASLDFRHVNRNRFRYRLLPDNKQWLEVSSPNQAAFTNLDPKQYTFQLQATNSHGIWSEQILSFKLIILPPLWMTWWAFVIYALLLTALLFYLFYRHKKTLREQQTINQHLRRVDQLKDEFLANTSHELRTPLNGIIGIAESLKEGSAGLQSAKTLNDLGLIIDGGKRLAQLINDILDFKKLTHHTLVLQRKAVDLHSVLNVVVSLLKPLAEHKNLALRNHLPKDLPLVYADEDRLQQIFHNLIGNAIKYTIKGEISISARVNINEIEICVADSGIGINSANVEEIFIPFEQLDISDKVSQKGTGLGLSVTRQLIEQHEGQIWVQSTIDVGSKFYFTLPCWLENQHGQSKQQLADEPEFFLNSHNVDTQSNHSEPVQKPIKDGKNNDTSQYKGSILIADDDPINLQVLTDLLQMNQYQVSSTKDGIEATELGLKEKFDLAILDIMMPGMSGYQVTKKLRQKYSAVELPILLLSARNQPGDVKAGFEAGANDYVTKPIEREVLLSRIHTMLLLGGLVEAKRQKEHTKTLQQACERLGKYFPKQMVNQIITNDQDNPLVAQRKQITILFADLAGFTSVSDRFEPEAITDILNSFLGRMGELVEQHQGILNEILGDGLVVLFGALDNMTKQQQAQNAASLSLKMQQAMTELSEKWLEAGFDHSVQLRIGVHQDFATVGNFGSKDIVAFRAVGSGVNFAARLESYCSAGEITVSYPIYAQCRDQFEFSELTEVLLKGFNHKHRVCQLVGLKK
ncbi:MAG: adenylate/guanylate cyclase domain-containing protein [Enterobacterales bacterium]|nr:adenylate/guanylate cyclase domain-containing protein [Enterobacterales bacterium]